MLCFHFQDRIKPGLVVHSSNPSTQKVEAGGTVVYEGPGTVAFNCGTPGTGRALWLGLQPGLHRIEPTCWTNKYTATTPQPTFDCYETGPHCRLSAVQANTDLSNPPALSSCLGGGGRGEVGVGVVILGYMRLLLKALQRWFSG